MRVLIVDDSSRNREILRLMLGRMPGLEVVGEAGDIAAARSMVARVHVDLLLLDMDLERHNGFSLLPHLAPGTKVVFTAAHSGFAVRAFEVEVFDYHVKPLREERLFRSIQQALTLRLPDSAETSRISVHRSGSARRFVSLETITAVLGDDNYSRILSGAEVHEDHRRLRDWECLLETRGFERLDRSHLVRPAMIDTLTPHGSGCIIRMRFSTVDLHLGATARARLKKMGYQ